MSNVKLFPGQDCVTMPNDTVLEIDVMLKGLLNNFDKYESLVWIAKTKKGEMEIGASHSIYEALVAIIKAKNTIVDLS